MVITHPQKSSRLGMPKKSKKSKKTAALESYFGPEADPEGNMRPEKAEWDSMEAFRTLRASRHVYHKGCDVSVRSSDSPENVWIAMVLSIRRRKTPLGIPLGWAQVQWYYSPRDVQALSIEGLPNDCFSSRERVLSDAIDLVPLTSFKSPVKVYKFNEEDWQPAEFDEKSYFHRYSLKDALDSPKLAPFPGQFSCICGTPYDPFPQDMDFAEAALDACRQRRGGTAPSRVELKADYMHYCPRPKCSRWFHETCLLHRTEMRHPEHTDFVGSLAVRRLAVDPDASFHHPKLARFTYEKPARGKNASVGEPSTRDVLAAALGPDRELGLPESLIAIAAMPIVRRAGQGTFSTAGNVRDVVVARRLVYQTLDVRLAELERLIRSLPESWDAASDALTYYRVWQFLGTQGMLASPRAAYWDRRVEELAVHAERPELHCPNCEGEFPVAI
ncbi:uncharacterized protein PHACADRAFT_208393 [Phanerochaete carnosa HHB-10118-sp]|uniref:BAH domain-containing protein n=1 Tax=Phanerochaete carnosa (strain HHB-10118-sp) TaxID=650164 RepID=K5V408_PHACS|nr:uncharacterized protein PHACADRAFT_208393 [Phanerochaete carnosa HHB-10118-sp]EKM57291.1 hypothetical protein PHACADRAFT_208393 [Phanerochaete carnosa HHB-10118-sp]